MKYQTPNYNNNYKTCRHCGMQIPRGAKVCNYCYKKQNSVGEKIFKVIGVYLAICVVMFILGALDENEESTNEVSQDIVTQNEEVKEEVSETEDAAEQKETEKEKEQKTNTFKYADITMEYLRSEIAYNSIDDKCLYVYFQMTNNSDENQSFRYLVTCKAFQDGIELESNYVYDCDEEKNGSKEIQPGATITVAEVFEIGDATENVTLEVRPFNIWSDRLLFEKEIQIAE